MDIVITCMGRLAHLRRSLPLAHAQFGARCIVVDYSCPEHCGDWVEAHFPRVLVVRVPGKDTFSMSAARNAGAAVAVAPWLFFVDADVLLGCGVVEELLRRLQPGVRYQREDFMRGATGTFVCSRADFERIGGFDEVYEGWGAEDVDLLERLAYAGVRRAALPVGGTSVIDHGDEDRVRYLAIKDRRSSQLVNRCYLNVKLDILRMGGHYPPIDTRRQLYRQVRDAVLGAIRTRKARHIQIEIGRYSLYGLENTKSLHYHLGGELGAPPPAFKSKSGLDSRGPKFPDVLRVMDRRWPTLRQHEACRDRPVFLLASGVRSGSTLLQRAMMRQIWMWGEPWGAEGLIDHLMAPFLRVSERSPRGDVIEGHPRFSGDLGRTWIARLYPHPERLKAASKAYLDRLFATGASEQGFDRWGLKEVRADVGAGAFFRWLYPHACIVLLVRNPYDAYRSYRRQGSAGILPRPVEMLDSPERFGEIWGVLAEGFANDCDALGAHLIRYEDLVVGGTYRDQLEAYLGFSLDDEALCTRIIGRASGPRVDPPSIGDELNRLERTVGPLAERLGYRLHGCS